MPSIFQQQSNAFSQPPRILLEAQTLQSNILGGVVPTPVPSGTGQGSGTLGGTEVIGTSWQHVTIVVPAGPIDVQFPHGLTRGGITPPASGSSLGQLENRYAPTAIFAIQELAEGSSPTAVYAVVWSKTNAGVITMSFSATGTWDVFYC